MLPVRHRHYSSWVPSRPRPFKSNKRIGRWVYDAAFMRGYSNFCPTLCRMSQLNNWWENDFNFFHAGAFAVRDAEKCLIPAPFDWWIKEWHICCTFVWRWHRPLLEIRYFHFNIYSEQIRLQITPARVERKKWKLITRASIGKRR